MNLAVKSTSVPFPPGWSSMVTWYLSEYQLGIQFHGDYSPVRQYNYRRFCLNRRYSANIKPKGEPYHHRYHRDAYVDRTHHTVLMHREGHRSTGSLIGKSVQNLCGGRVFLTYNHANDTKRFPPGLPHEIRAKMNYLGWWDIAWRRKCHRPNLTAEDVHELRNLTVCWLSGVRSCLNAYSTGLACSVTLFGPQRESWWHPSQDRGSRLIISMYNVLSQIHSDNE